MQFKIKKFTDPKDLPADYFSSLVGWTNRTWTKGKVVMENTPGPFRTDTPAPNEPLTQKEFMEDTKSFCINGSSGGGYFKPLVNPKTGKTYREENHEFSAELADIDKLLKQLFIGGGTWK